jgi:hypothetical protein
MARKHTAGVCVLKTVTQVQTAEAAASDEREGAEVQYPAADFTA